jgi:hypothetical protein
MHGRRSIFLLGISGAHFVITTVVPLAIAGVRRDRDIFIFMIVCAQHTGLCTSISRRKDRALRLRLTSGGQQYRAFHEGFLLLESR